MYNTVCPYSRTQRISVESSRVVVEPVMDKTCTGIFGLYFVRPAPDIIIYNYLDRSRRKALLLWEGGREEVLNVIGNCRVSLFFRNKEIVPVPIVPPTLIFLNFSLPKNACDLAVILIAVR